MEVIIPGLPNDIAHQWLFRLPFSQIHSLRYVSKAWKSEIQLLEIFRLRKSARIDQSLIIFSRVNRYTLPRLFVSDPETGFSSCMPHLPDSKELPTDCRTAIVGTDLVVMGGYDRRTKRCLDSVFIFEFYSSTWRPGANMPDGPRTSFACAVYDNRTVFVAGGHNEKTKFTSSWTYDVTTNKWNQLPDMAKDRFWEYGPYNYEGLIYHDKFQVIKRGWEIKLEIFDMSSKQWSQTNNAISDYISDYCVEGSNHQKLYRIRGSNLGVLEDDKWKFFARLPAGMSSNKSHLIALSGYLWLITSEYGRPYKSYKMDLKDRTWIKSTVQMKYFGNVDSCYSLII